MGLDEWTAHDQAYRTYFIDPDGTGRWYGGRTGDV
jgi:hypothetical protein